MGGRTFRSRWVVRWGIVFGGLCVVAGIVFLLGAARQSQTRANADQQAQHDARVCEEQLNSGSEADENGPCSRSGGDAPKSIAKGVITAGVLLALGLTQVIGAARVGVTLSGPGVIIRNPLRTYRLRWGEIDTFRTEVGYTGPMSYAFGRVDLRNGDSHRIEAVCAMPWEPKPGFGDERVIVALNAELDARRAELAEAAAARAAEASDAGDVRTGTETAARSDARAEHATAATPDARTEAATAVGVDPGHAESDHVSHAPGAVVPDTLRPTEAPQVVGDPATPAS